MSDLIVELEPWRPWPLLLPAAVLLVAVVVSVIGARRSSIPVRELGFVLFVLAGFAMGAMAWSMSAIWDTEQRSNALIAHGYRTPTFGGVDNPTAIASGIIEFHAIGPDGERVRGNMVSLGDDRWRVRILGD